MNIRSDVSFINRRESVKRLVRRKISRKPGGRALFVLGTPLGGAGFAGDFHFLQAGGMRRPRPSTDRLD